MDINEIPQHEFFKIMSDDFSEGCRLAEEDDFRFLVITGGIKVEYLLYRIMTNILGNSSTAQKVSKEMSFNSLIKHLESQLKERHYLYERVDKIRKARNIYAHEVDHRSANRRAVMSLADAADNYPSSSDHWKRIRNMQKNNDCDEWGDRTAKIQALFLVTIYELWSIYRDHPLGAKAASQTEQ